MSKYQAMTNSSHTVFLSYRRQDSTGITHRVYDWLVDELGTDQVFMDVDSIKPGFESRAVIDAYVEKCDTMLVIVGGRWRGKASWWRPARIMASEDLVRYEVARALQRKVLVIPLLIDSADLPPRENLPDDLHSLHDRQHLRLHTNQYFRQDMRWVLSAIRKTDEIPATGGPPALLLTTVSIETQVLGWTPQDFEIDEQVDVSTEFAANVHLTMPNQIFAVYYQVTCRKGTFWIGFTNREHGEYRTKREVTKYIGTKDRTSYELSDNVTNTVRGRFPELQNEDLRIVRIRCRADAAGERSARFYVTTRRI